MTIKSLILHISLFLVLAGCSSKKPGFLIPPQEKESGKEATPLEYFETIHSEEKNNLLSPHIEAGLEYIYDNELEKANEQFAQAIKLSPFNSGLHFLKGFTYHLMGIYGDSSKMDLAKTGYEYALNFDQTNAYASFYLGLIHLDRQNYLTAQEYLIHANKYAPNSENILSALAVASYRKGDIETAYIATESSLEKKSPKESSIRNASLVYAAAGEKSKADGYFRQYAGNGSVPDYRKNRLRQRLSQWNQTFEQISTHENYAGVFGDNGDDSQDPSEDDPSGNDTDNDEDNNGTEDGKGETTGDNGTESAANSKMALVDVVIIRSTEQNRTRKGINLLNLLENTQATFTPYNYSHTDNLGESDTRTLTRSLSLSTPTVDYSLNIFNDNYDQNKVLARPTLLATDGQPSKFKSGGTWMVQTNADSDGQVSIDEKDFGISLEIRPTFRDNGFIELDITAKRTFIEERSSSANFSNFAQLAKTSTEATAILKLGETMILSGLSEEEDEELQDGVPLLQDIPLIQYFFSKQETLQFRNSILILVTPRKPQYTTPNGVPIASPYEDLVKSNSLAVQDFKKNKGWKLDPTSNLALILKQMEGNEFYENFVKADLKLERWDNFGQVSYTLKKALEFIYY